MFEFTKEEFEAIIKDCDFDKELLEIAIMLHKKYSRTKMLLELRDKNLATSERVLYRNIKKVKDRIIKVLKRRYFNERYN